MFSPGFHLKTPMIQRFAIAALCLSAAVGPPAASAQRPAPAPAVYRDSLAPIDARVRDLMRRMRVEDKFWQLFMLPGSRDNPADD
jgi:beta-glucosidase